METKRGEPAVNREDLEDAWRQRVGRAHFHYRAAADRWNTLSEEQPEGLPPTPEIAVLRASQLKLYLFTVMKQL